MGVVSETKRRSSKLPMCGGVKYTIIIGNGTYVAHQRCTIGNVFIIVDIVSSSRFFYFTRKLLVNVYAMLDYDLTTFMLYDVTIDEWALLPKIIQNDIFRRVAIVIDRRRHALSVLLCFVSPTIRHPKVDNI